MIFTHILRFFCIKNVSFILFIGCLFLQSCTTSSTPFSINKEELVGPYALEGPPLYIVGSFKDTMLHGRMDRQVMVGMGSIHLYETRYAPSMVDSVDTANSPRDVLFCTGKIFTEPSEKARIRGVMQSPTGEKYIFVLNPAGPDQGVGIARTEQKSDMLMFFFHSCPKEAERRFPLVERSLAGASEKLQK